MKHILTFVFFLLTLTSFSFAEKQQSNGTGVKSDDPCACPTCPLQVINECRANLADAPRAPKIISGKGKKSKSGEAGAKAE